MAPQSSLSRKECPGSAFPPLLIPQLSLDPLRPPPSFPQTQTESAWIGGGGEARDAGAGAEG